MSLQYIIDGYNVINHPLFKSTHSKIKEPQIALLEFIKTKKLCGSPNNKVIVVFDGYFNTAELKQSGSDIKVVFSREETADEKIRKISQAQGNTKNIVVVSDDKEISLFIKAISARSMSVSQFIDPSSRSKKSVNPSGKQTKWERELLKTELNYSQIEKINQELKKRWL